MEISTVILFWCSISDRVVFIHLIFRLGILTLHYKSGCNGIAGAYERRWGKLLPRDRAAVQRTLRKAVSRSEGQDLCSPLYPQENASLLWASVLPAWLSGKQTPVWRYILEDKWLRYILTEHRRRNWWERTPPPGKAAPTQPLLLEKATQLGGGGVSQFKKGTWSKWTSTNRMSHYLILTPFPEKS